MSARTRKEALFKTMARCHRSGEPIRDIAKRFNVKKSQAEKHIQLGERLLSKEGATAQ